MDEVYKIYPAKYVDEKGREDIDSTSECNPWLFFPPKLKIRRKYYLCNIQKCD